MNSSNTSPPRSFQRPSVGRASRMTLIRAAKQADLPTVTELLLEGANVNCRDSSADESERCSFTFEGCSTFAPPGSELVAPSAPPQACPWSNFHPSPPPTTTHHEPNATNARRNRDYIAMDKFKDVEYSPMICNTSAASSRGATPRIKRVRPLSPAPLALRGLCDYLTSPHISMPVTVGFFEKAGVKDNHTNKLYGELKTFTPSAAKIRLRVTWLLVFTPVFLALICGYAVGLMSNWQAGMGVSLAFLLVKATLLTVILVGSRSRHWGWAIICARGVSRMLNRLYLFLKMLFLYPKAKRIDGSEVRFLLIRQSILSGNPNQYILDVLEEILNHIESLYGSFNSRIFRVFQPSEESGRFFKSACCIPIFILFLIYLLALFICLTMIRVFSKNLKELWKDTAVTACFIFMLCISGLGTIICLPPVYRAIRYLCRAPRNRIKQMSDDNVDMETLGAAVKKELKRAGTLLDCFDRHYGNVYTRVVIVLDGADTFNQERIIQCLEMLYSIFSDFHRSPFIVIVSTDVQVLLSECEGDVNQAVENLSLLNAVVNLQIHMQHLTTLHFSTPQTPVYNGTFCIRGGVSFESLSMVSLCRFHDRALESARTLTEQLLAKGQMSEMNLKILPHLLATVFYTGRHLRLRQVDFKLTKLIAWTILACNWPFRTAWIAWYLQDYWDRLDSRVTLPQIDERIDSKLNLLAANLKVFFNLDRDPAKYTAYMNSTGHILTVGDLKKFYPSSLFLMYQLRQFIRNYFANKPLMTPKLSRKPFEFQSCTLDEDGDAISVISNPSALTKCTPLGEAMPPLTKTPSSSRRCLVKLKDGYPESPLSTLTVDEVCELIADIDGISFRHLKDYQNRLREMNITGLVLNVCELSQLRPELDMTFGDWQLFETLVLRLRELESGDGDLAALSGGAASGVHSEYRSPFDLEDVPRPLERSATMGSRVAVEEERHESAPVGQPDGILAREIAGVSHEALDDPENDNLPTPLHHLQMLCKQILKEARQEKASRHFSEERKAATAPGSSRRRKSRTFSLPQLGQRFTRRKQTDYLEEASRVYGFTKGARAYEMQRCYVVAAPHQRAYEEGEEDPEAGIGIDGGATGGGESGTEDEEGESADLPPPPLLSGPGGVAGMSLAGGGAPGSLVGPLPPLLGGECTCEFWFNLERQRRFLSQQHAGPFLHHHQACAAGRAVPVHMETVHPDLHHQHSMPPPPPPVPPSEDHRHTAGSTL